LRLAPNIPDILADAGMIEQVVMNLALNARDAMPEGGRLIIQTSSLKVDESLARQHPGATAGEFVQLRVADTGRGIAAAVLPRIFEPFFTTKEVGQGTGLGLATVYGIVREHRGWLRVRSEVGEGSEFEVFLPALADLEQIALPVPAPASERIGGETILVVEDEAMLRNLTGAILRRQGYEVLEAANGPEALAVWGERKARIDLVFTDVVMPGGITGRDLGKTLQTERPGLKIIYTSGYSPETYDDGGFFVEGSNFLSKPYRSQDLLVAIRRSLTA
jgi:CheY-like chemotaxis protein